MRQRFEGTDDYVATEDLKVAVNAAIALERPLLIKGEPGTGKTVLAYEIAKALDAPLITWHIKSTTKAQASSWGWSPSGPSADAGSVHWWWAPPPPAPRGWAPTWCGCARRTPVR